MGASWLWARSDVRRGWSALLFVAVLVALSAGAVMAGVAGARRTSTSVERFLDAAGYADVTMYTQTGPLDAAFRRQIEGDPRIDHVNELRVAIARPTAVDGDGSMIVVPDNSWDEVAKPLLIAGAYPIGSDQIAMTEEAQRITGLAVGDVVPMHMLDGVAMEACVTTGVCEPIDAGEATITGVIRMVSDLAPGPFGEANFVAPASFLDTRGGDSAAVGFITDLLLVEGADPEAVATELSTQVPDGDVTNARRQDAAGARRAADIQRQALLIGTTIAAAAGLLICGQAFGRYLTRRAPDVPPLEALGMSRGQRWLAGWVPCLVATLIGGVLAVPVMIGLSPLFPMQMARRADPDVGVHADLTVIVIGAAITMLVGAVASAASASFWSRTRFGRWSATRVSTISVLAERLQIRPVPAMGSRFALEPGTGRRRLPVVPALLGTVAAVSVIAGSLLVSSSVDALLATPARYGAPWSFQVSAGERLDEVAVELGDDDRVEAAAVGTSGELNVGVDEQNMMQTSAVGLLSIVGRVDPLVLEGRPPSGPDEVAVGSDTLRDLGLSVGDQLWVGGIGDVERMAIVGHVVVPIVSRSATDVGIVLGLEEFRRMGGTELVADIDSEDALLVRATDSGASATLAADLAQQGLGVNGPYRQSTVTAC